MDAILRDLRHATRLLRRSPGFTLLAALTIALGIGPTTTIISVANGLLVRTPVGVREPGGLLSVHAREGFGRGFSTMAYPDFEALRDGSGGRYRLSALEIFMAGLAARGGEGPERVTGMLVSADYFGILGTRPAVGRLFVAGEDDTPGGDPVVVLSHRLWTRRFGGDPSVVGRSIALNGGSYTVVGVAQEGFQGHVSAADFALWVPVTMRKALTGVDLGRNTTGITAVGRVSPGASLEQARAAMTTVWQRLRAEHDDLRGDEGSGTARADGPGGMHVVVARYSVMIDQGRGPVTVFLALLLLVTGGVLLIASANVAGVFLARAAARSREIAIRLAMGAGRTQVVRLLVAESVLVFLLGGAAGAALAFWAARLLAAVRLPLPVQFAFDFTPDLPVLAVALVVTLAAGVFAGLTPAIRAGRQDVATVLKGSGVATGGARLRSAFVVAQVAGSVVLLVVGAVLLRALARADSVDLGFDPRNVHVLSLDLSMQRYTDERAAVFFRDLEERSAALPGVQAAALVTMPPMGFERAFTSFRTPENARYEQAGINAVSPRFFETMRIGLVAGRVFAPTDRSGTAPVVVVNREAARRFWPGRDAVGRPLEGRNRPYTIVGVVEDIASTSLGAPASPMVYFPFEQWGGKQSASLVVRAETGTAPVARAVRAVALALDGDLPAMLDAPYEQVIGVSLVPNRVAAAVSGAMGLLGLVLAAVGLFGLLSYVVSLRSREMGIRMALGASPEAVRRLVLRQGVRLVALGLLCGGPVALGAAFLMRGMLVGLSPADPLTFGAVVGLLIAVGVSASWLPARRATAGDPAVVLRSE